MEKNLNIHSATEKEVSFVWNKIREYNAKNVPLKKGQVVEDIFRVIKDSEGNVVAGIFATLLPHTDLEINGMWASEDCIEKDILLICGSVRKNDILYAKKNTVT